MCQRHRGLPGRRRGRRSGGFARTLVDPAPDQRDLRGWQRIFVLWHLRLDPAEEPLDHDAARAGTRPDGGAVASPVQRVSVGREREAPLALLGAMTFEAVLVDDWLDLAFEVDARRRCAPAVSSIPGFFRLKP